MTTKTPTIEELLRLKPNAKGNLYLIGDGLAYRYAPRLGRHLVHCQGEAEHFESETDALESAKRFKAQLQAGTVKAIGALGE